MVKVTYSPVSPRASSSCSCGDCWPLTSATQPHRHSRTTATFPFIFISDRSAGLISLVCKLCILFVVAVTVVVAVVVVVVTVVYPKSVILFAM